MFNFQGMTTNQIIEHHLEVIKRKQKEQEEKKEKQQQKKIKQFILTINFEEKEN